MNRKKEEIKYPWFKYYKNIERHMKYPNTSMYELVKKVANKYSSNIAYEWYGSKVTYKSLLRKIDNCADAYLKLGIKKGDIVSIIMPNTPEAIISFYALNKIGAINNMIHPLSAVEEIKYNVELTKSEYALVADLAYPTVKKIKDLFKKIIYLPICESMDPITKIGYKLTQGRKYSTPLELNVIPYSLFLAKSKLGKVKTKVKVSGSDTAVILYSGGTTGKPKGIELTNNNFNSLVISDVEINGVIKPNLTYLAIMPIFHGFGLGCTIHAAFSSGATAIILPTVNPKTFDKTILKLKPNIIACVPSLLESLPNSKILKDEDLSFLKCVACGGDTLDETLNKKLDAFFENHNSIAKVRVSYGMSECTAGVTTMPLEETRYNSIGIPNPDDYIKIVKPGTEEELPYGETGEICISGPTVMKGYINDPEETKLVLRKHKDKQIWLHSGDLAYMDKDGFIFFTSRLKRMIVSSGYNVYPGQIEKIICAHPYVKACAVVGLPHPYKKEVVKAYIVLNDGLELNSQIKDEIRSYCENNIAHYALPYAYGYRKELPKTKIGKIAYKELINDEGEDND